MKIDNNSCEGRRKTLKISLIREGLRRNGVNDTQETGSKFHHTDRNGICEKEKLLINIDKRKNK